MPKPKKQKRAARREGLFDSYPCETDHGPQVSENEQEILDWPEAETCAVCRGRGWLVLPDEYDESECDACGGTGYVLTLLP